MADIKRCEGCGIVDAVVKTCVTSTMSTHPAASKVQKRVWAEVKFFPFDTVGTEAELCERCQKDVINGMSHGGNIE